CRRSGSRGPRDRTRNHLEAPPQQIPRDHQRARDARHAQAAARRRVGRSDALAVPASPRRLTNTSWLLFVAAAFFAVADWGAVARRLDRLEYIAKPATIVALIGVALTLTPHIEARRSAFVVALVFSLAGDVFLMLPGDFFVQGLSSFLVGHIAYIVGLRIG